MSTPKPDAPLTTPFNDLATLTGRPRRLSAGGRVYRLYPQTVGTLARFQDYLDAQTADPDDAVFANLDGLSIEAQQYLLGEGCWRIERRRALFGTAKADDLACSVGGITELLYLSVRRGDRRFTRSHAQNLYWRLDDAGHRKLAWTVWGQRAKPDYASPADSRPEPVNWYGVFHTLMREPFGYPPHWIERMTWPQVLCALGDGEAPGAGIDLKRFPGGKDELRRRRAEDPWFP
jgi:hypothetical protein